jgi:hypothetical protein
LAWRIKAGLNPMASISSRGSSDAAPVEVVAIEAVEPDLAGIERAPAYEYVAIVEAAAFAWRNPRRFLALTGRS